MDHKIDEFLEWARFWHKRNSENSRTVRVSFQMQARRYSVASKGSDSTKSRAGRLSRKELIGLPLQYPKLAGCIG